MYPWIIRCARSCDACFALPVDEEGDAGVAATVSRASAKIGARLVIFIAATIRPR